MRVIDVFTFTLDLVLFTYFTQIALNTTSITTRIVACFAMTAEIFFMVQRLKMIKSLRGKREE